MSVASLIIEKMIVYVIIILVVLSAVGYFFYKDYSDKKAFEEFAKEKNLTLAELGKHDGIASKRIFVGVKGDIFDVSTSSFYTPGGSYHIFAGKDASTSLAKGDLEGTYLNTPEAELNEEEKHTLDEWHDRFLSKYRIVGKVLK